MSRLVNALDKMNYLWRILNGSFQDYGVKDSWILKLASKNCLYVTDCMLYHEQGVIKFRKYLVITLTFLLLGMKVCTRLANLLTWYSLVVAWTNPCSRICQLAHLIRPSVVTYKSTSMTISANQIGERGSTTSTDSPLVLNDALSALSKPCDRKALSQPNTDFTKENCGQIIFFSLRL